jgi:uncharacterized protein YbjT (DUF2867 family)
MKIIMVAIVYFLFIIIIFSLQLATTAVNAFAGTKTSVRRPATDLSAAVTSGDKVLVLGGTGGVGQLTIGKLLNHPYNLSVRTTSRDPTKAKETISIFGDATGDGDHKNLEIVKLDLLAEDTTALEIAMSDVAAVVISVGTTAFPTMKWKGGNTPKAIDQYAVERVARVAASKAPELKRIVLVTSVGVERTDQMPFVILNLFGVLDAKKKGEEAIMDAVTSKSGGRFDYVVIRPGRLVGGPYTNEDLAKVNASFVLFLPTQQYSIVCTLLTNRYNFFYVLFRTHF